MSEIISIDGSKVKVGLDNGTMKVVPLAALTYSNPKVGDEVKVYEDGDDVVVSRIKSARASAEVGTRHINKIVYILVTFFVGSIGVHRFLRGQIGIGILYVLTLGLFGLLTLIDFIISIVKMTKYDGDEFTFTSNGKWAEPDLR